MSVVFKYTFFLNVEFLLSRVPSLSIYIGIYFSQLKINLKENPVIHFFTIVFARIMITKLSNIFDILLCLIHRTSKLCVCKSKTMEGQVIAFSTTQLCMQNDAFVFSICLQFRKVFQMPRLRTFKSQKIKSTFYILYSMQSHHVSFAW